MAESSFKDYADLNFRYLKATGLVGNKGKGISLVPEKKVLARQLIDTEVIPASDLDYLRGLCDGATLPTDELSGALIIADNLANLLAEKGFSIDLTGRKLDNVADVSIARHEMEQQLAELNELDYANQQKDKIDEIIGFIELLLTRKKAFTLKNNIKIEIPHGEAPAYFEWVIWRAFLVINSQINKPWEARRFKIDQDFLPVGTAPGNGPDLIFEFDDFILVIEVTLTTSSRQEAVEGEPVRRHVAKYAEEQTHTGKEVYGLFLAVNIDTNTANTFRLGEWYLKDDRKVALHIVPMQLEDFKSIFEAAVENTTLLLPSIKELLRSCRMYSNENAPEWKRKIEEITQQTVTSIKNSMQS